MEQTVLMRGQFDLEDLGGSRSKECLSSEHTYMGPSGMKSLLDVESYEMDMSLLEDIWQFLDEEDEAT